MNIRYKAYRHQTYRNHTFRKYFHTRPWLVACFTLLFYTSAFSQIPVGMITNLEGQVTFSNKPEKKIDFGTDVFLHDEIKIGEDSKLMITYYLGCRQEWYGENTSIQADKDRSNIKVGKVLKHQTYDCETPEIIMSDENSFKKAAFHFRAMEPSNEQSVTSNSLQNKSSLEESSDSVKFKLWTVKQNNKYFLLGESIVIYMLANKDVYVKLDYFQADNQVIHLIPNLFKDKQSINAHTIHAIGGRKSELNLTAGRPFGSERIRALVSVKPFPESFNSSQVNESAREYEERLNKMLKNMDEGSEIHDFFLTFRTTP